MRALTAVVARRLLSGGPGVAVWSSRPGPTGANPAGGAPAGSDGSGQRGSNGRRRKDDDIIEGEIL